jgi:hypothetical protein
MKVAHLKRYTDRSLAVCGFVHAGAAVFVDNLQQIPPGRRVCGRCWRRLCGLRINARVLPRAHE